MIARLKVSIFSAMPPQLTGSLCGYPTKVYYLTGTTGLQHPFGWEDRVVQLKVPAASGGTGGTSASMAYGTALTAPAVTKPGYVFIGWSQAVPATVGAENATYTAQWNLLGDIGSDNHINTLDALMARRASSGTTPLTDIQKLFADVSKDGKVNSLDALMILKYTSGKITSF